MKTTSSPAERSASSRELSIVDTLVLMLAVALFAAWILGTLFLYIFPAESGTGADSQNVAVVDSAEDSGDNRAASALPTNSAAAFTGNQAGGSNRAEDATVPNANQIAAASGGLTSKEKTALQRKISTLEKQLDAKSKEVAQLRKDSAKQSATPAVDTSKYEKQISQLKKEKGFLDGEIKRLNKQSDTQKKKIDILQDQLADAAERNAAAEATAQPKAEKDISEARGASPGNQPLEFRDWISSKGNPARLAFVRWENDKIVVVNEENKTFKLTLDRLSPEDQQYVNSKR